MAYKNLVKKDENSMYLVQKHIPLTVILFRICHTVASMLVEIIIFCFKVLCKKLQLSATQNLKISEPLK